MAGNPLKRRTFSSPSSSSAFSPCYSNVKQVFLSDWWLIKPDGYDCRGLRIGGINSNQRLGIRVFHSAEIQKRHDSVTLETADGITVYICGTINRSRTFENGFSQQVCDHFGFGFPYDWDEFVDGSCPEDKADSKFTGPIGNLPKCLIHEFAPSIKLSTSMFEDILQKFGNKAKEGASESSQTNETQNITDKDAPSKAKKKSAAQLNPETRREKLLKTAVDERTRSDCNVMRKGPLTRSMAHMAQLENKKKNDSDMAQSEKEKKKNETDMAQSEKEKKKKKNETDMAQSEKEKKKKKKKNETEHNWRRRRLF